LEIAWFCGSWLIRRIQVVIFPWFPCVSNVNSLATLSHLRAQLSVLAPLGSFTEAEWGAVDASFVYSQEEAQLRNASPGRRGEFIAGRASLRRALTKAGFIPGALVSDEEGLPVLPLGAVASISHSRGLCCAVAGKSTSFAGLAIDIERTDRLRAPAAKRVMHPLERDWASDDPVRWSLLFSLKEAFYKMQFPRWKVCANFKDLALDVDLAGGRAQALQVAPIFGEALRQRSDQICFSFALFGSYVASLCWLPAD
jgi:4'-phosphopantetheinyl transferase EntD